MNRFIYLLIYLSILFNLTGCTQPVGDIVHNSSGNGSGNGNGVNYDFLMLRPNRILYDADGGANGRFDRQADLRVFVADNGEFKSLDPADSLLTIEVIENPGLNSEVITAVNTHHIFSLPGRYIIRGTYNEQSDEYSIEVRGSFVNPGDGSDFVDIIWL